MIISHIHDPHRGKTASLLVWNPHTYICIYIYIYICGAASNVGTICCHFASTEIPSNISSSSIQITPSIVTVVVFYKLFARNPKLHNKPPSLRVPAYLYTLRARSGKPRLLLHASDNLVIPHRSHWKSGSNEGPCYHGPTREHTVPRYAQTFCHFRARSQ